ncbi:hypothetical protein ROZALSC1DRAFT_28004, partial [Rozella allomycis CSF55]
MEERIFDLKESSTKSKFQRSINNDNPRSISPSGSIRSIRSISFSKESKLSISRPSSKIFSFDEQEVEELQEFVLRDWKIDADYEKVLKDQREEEADIEKDSIRQEAYYRLFQTEENYIKMLKDMKSIQDDMNLVELSLMAFNLLKEHEVFYKSFESLYRNSYFINDGSTLIAKLIKSTFQIYTIVLGEKSEISKGLERESTDVRKCKRLIKMLHDIYTRLKYYQELCQSIVRDVPDHFPDVENLKAIEKLLKDLFLQIDERKLLTIMRSDMENLKREIEPDPYFNKLFPEIPRFISNKELSKIMDEHRILAKEKFLEFQTNTKEKHLEKILLVLTPSQLVFLHKNKGKYFIKWKPISLNHITL